MVGGESEGLRVVRKPVSQAMTKETGKEGPSAEGGARREVSEGSSAEGGARREALAAQHAEKRRMTTSQRSAPSRIS
jgi:hypothetical protein